jgi:GNAT superfamily N-acetyltransferase
MIRIATIDDIDSLVELRIKLLNESSNNIENYNWEKYSQVLKTFYYDGLLNGKVIAYLAEENKKNIAVSMMCFYNITPLLHNLDGKMALLTDMYTIPECRNKGYGMNLLNSIMEHAKKLGYVKVILNATESGRKLYGKYGFKDVNGEMSYKFM